MASEHASAMRPATDEGKKTPLRFNFTKTSVSAIKPPANGWSVVYDTKVRGLLVLTTARGVKTFYLARRRHGQYKRHRLGRWPDITIEYARKLADEVRADDAGNETQEVKQIALRMKWTMADLFNHYIPHAKRHKKSWESDQDQFDRYLKDRHGWTTKQLGTVTQEDIRLLHAAIGDDHGIYAANRLLALLSVMFKFASLPNVCRGVKRFTETERDRILTGEEFPRFMAAVLEEKNTTIRDYILISLFTGARRSNTMAMAWKDIDLAAAVWRIPETKSGEPVRVHLPEPALEVLRARKADNEAEEDPSTYVFPGRSGGHLQEAKAAWSAILDRAGIQNLHLHDLRRTAGSYAAATGASMLIIGKALGHKSTASTHVYARLSLDPVKGAMDKAVDAMITAANGKPPAPAAPAPAAPAAPTIDILGELERLAALKAAGVITDEELALLKARLLSK
ncbi:MAG TPA: tyrosine-type recombinase/integrase [Phycisphaerae bacterium]|nr:tyrosine-type recombinase/integrase [Phycisphaerae bacterium]